MHPIEHFCCQNNRCPDHGHRGQGNLYFRGWSGQGQRIRMVYCRTCKQSFSERKGTPLENARLPADKALSLLEHVREGCGTRATSRLVKVDKNTVTRYVRLAGRHADTLHHELVAFSPRTQEVQLDEKWSFVAKKGGHVEPDDPAAWGSPGTTRPSIRSIGCCWGGRG